MPGWREDIPCHKVCLVGEYGVGKSTIFARVQGKHFNGKDMMATEYDYEIYEPKHFKIRLCDTGGMEQYESITSGSYYRNSVCLIFVYDITNIDSLDYLAREYNLIAKKHYWENIKIVLFRNKCDVGDPDTHHVKNSEEEHFLNLNPKLKNKLCYSKTISGLNDIDYEGNSVIEEFFQNKLVEILCEINTDNNTKSKRMTLKTPSEAQNKSTSNCWCTS